MIFLLKTKKKGGCRGGEGGKVGRWEGGKVGRWEGEGEGGGFGVDVFFCFLFVRFPGYFC